MKKMLLRDFNSIDNIYYAHYYFNKSEMRGFHIHDHFEIYFLLDGEIKYKFYENDILLQKNHIQFVFPENEHEYEYIESLKPCRIINISFPFELFDESVITFINQINKTRKCSIKIFKPEIIKDFSQKCDLMMNTSNKNIRRSILNNILSSYFIEYSKMEKENTYSSPNWLNKAVKEMEKTENFIIGLVKFIELSGKSQEYLNREMKKNYGTTPTEFINNLRLNYSTRLMNKSDSKILPIIFEVGFNNVSHFENLFKKKYGLSPRNYINNNRNIF